MVLLAKSDEAQTYPPAYPKLGSVSRPARFLIWTESKFCMENED